MSCMFRLDVKFNQNLNNWNTSKATNIRDIFFQTNFNQDIINAQHKTYLIYANNAPFN